MGIFASRSIESVLEHSRSGASGGCLRLDLTLFDDPTRMGGPGDFAAAYVIRHEVGHHVQNLLGTSVRCAGIKHDRYKTGWLGSE